MEELTIREVARRGGEATLKRYGREHYSRIGRLHAGKPRNKNKKKKGSLGG